MQIFLEKVLNGHQLSAIADLLADASLFVDGRTTAGRSAKKVKSNLQAQPAAVETKGAVAMVEKALLAHPVFKAAAQPEQFARILFSRYEPGMHYGAHVDDPVIAGVRTDLSFTLFISEPDTYQGGELVLQKHDGDESIKLGAGSLVLYPSTTVHHVTEVTEGYRLAAVGWVQSRVRSAEQREILFDLHNTLANLPDIPENESTRLSLLKRNITLCAVGWINARFYSVY